MEEVEFQCPYCWESQTNLVDLSVSDQDYIEDCTVCCRPIRFLVAVSFDANGDHDIALQALHEDD